MSEEALQIAEKRREVKSKGEREKYTQLNADFQSTARREKKAFLNEQCKEIKENNRISKTRDVFWRRQWHPTPVLLPGKSHGQRSLVGCRPWGREESDTTEQLHFHFSLSCIGEGNYLSIIKAIYDKPTANIILNGEKLKALQDQE